MTLTSMAGSVGEKIQSQTKVVGKVVQINGSSF